ncbi:sensor histidine kinase [Xylophilus sp.]|uniref:sensor histidine kinase n=1 Tax=Xylophilus sp. TaxID=2653893 RepID=UPI0013BCDDAF|nr:ATP-binding protein [Xylophilus sp.]KAF1043184.1 MAG: Swarming motility regulation sensor protein RssA [Xylophilus sp.]
MPERAAPAVHGIRTRLLAILLPVLCLLLAVDSWSDYRTMARSLQTAYDEALAEPLYAIGEGMTLDGAGEPDMGWLFSVEGMFESTHALHKHLYVGLLALDGPAPAPNRAILGPSDLPPSDGAAAAGAIGFYEATYHGYAVRVAMLQRVVHDGMGNAYRLVAKAAESTGRRERARQALLHRELLQGLRMVLVTACLVWLGLVWTLRPLERLRAALRARGSGQLQPIDARGVPGEVAPLVEAVNQHIADHRRVLARQADFLADASHQLRTPLAIMTTQAGYALREHDPARQHETLQAIAAQLERSRRLSDQLLSLAHAQREGPGGAAGAAVVDLNAIARDVVLQYLPLARERGHDLGFDDAGGAEAADAASAPMALPVRAQPLELHEALANLLHNAIQHVPAGGRITVAACVRGGQACAEVRDDGPGIAAGRREDVFGRFRQSAGGGAAAAAGGAGLGMAIARAYARRNHGDILLDDGDPRADGSGVGLCARLVLPLAA